jgi:CBS-domain-containing membrane protein
MSRQVTCLAESSTISDVNDLFESKRIRHVLVVDRGGRLTGIIGHEDVHARAGKTAAEIMTSDPYTLDVDDDVSIGITELICRRISCLPITAKDGSLKGIITKTDFLLALQCAIQTLGGVVKHLNTFDIRGTSNPQTARKVEIGPADATSELQTDVSIGA